VPTTTVSTILVNDGTVQRSEVRSINVAFSNQVTFTGGASNAASAFQLRRVMDGTLVGLTATVTNVGGQTAVKLTFTGAGTDPESDLNSPSPSLEDGKFTLTVFANDVTGPDGLALDGDRDGNPGGDYVSPNDTLGGSSGQLHLYRLFGDANGDGVVDQTDLGQFRSSFNASTGNPAYLSYLDADNSGVIDQLDLGQFRTRFNANVFAVPPPPTFYVNPATGNDLNDGRTPQTAWKTWDKLVSAVADGTITGGAWVTTNGAPADLSTIPTTAGKQAWYAQYLAGQIEVTGAHIYIDTTEAPLQVTAPLILPPGCEIESATSSLTNLEVNVPMPASEVWAQPDAVNDPNVWGTTSDTNYHWTGLYEQMDGQWAQLQPIASPNLTQALPALQSIAGSFWVDPATNRLYTHAIAGGNPNTDGIQRQYVPEWVEANSNNRVVELRSGIALRIGGDGGFGFDSVTGEAQGINGVGSGEWGNISIIDSCEWSRAGKHTFSAVGNLSSGLTVFHDDTAEEGPGGISIVYWTHFADYTSFSGTGSIMTIYDGDSTVNGTANVDRPGGSDADPTYLALIAHSNDATQSFSERLIENCNFGGTVSLGGPETALAIMQDTVLGGTFVTTAGTSIVNRTKVGFRMPIFDGNTAIVTDSIFVPGSQYTSEPSGIQGTVTLNRCTLDFTHGDIYSTAWTRTGAVDLIVTNSVILNQQNLAYGLVDGLTPSDQVLIDHSLIQGPTSYLLIQTYNPTANNPMGSTVTYAQALAGVPGITITNTAFVSDAKLDPTTYEPLSGSPAIGQAIPVNNAPDYTGQIWAVRRTAGALEAPVTPSHLSVSDGPGLKGNSEQPPSDGVQSEEMADVWLTDADLAPKKATI
jgi:hypothetical protein